MKIAAFLISHMSHNSFKLLEGALLISDAHYSDQRPELLKLIQAINDNKVQATQLILMGDIFDLLFGPIKETHLRNQDMIKIINEISQKIEVIYFEGNHDFTLGEIFPHVTIFPLRIQPVSFSFNGKKGLMAHGDFGEDMAYKIYTFLIRSKVVLHVLGMVDKLTNHGVLKRLDRYLSQKEDCNEFHNFESYITKRLTPFHNSDIDYFIEGHYHQNDSFNITNFVYINLAAFACNQRYFIVQSSDERNLLHQVVFSKESS